MEIWFVSALGGAILAGVSNFYFKQAAVRGYNADIFSFYGGVTSVVIVGAVVLFQHETLRGYGALAALVFLSGYMTAWTNVFKVQALRFIDSTIYFPLFKLLAPTIAIIAGVTLFHESFSRAEWIGMILGLTVPLLLITKAENGRQQNLLAGLFLVLASGAISGAIAIIGKYATDMAMPILVILMFTAAGIAARFVVTFAFKKGMHGLYVFIKDETSRGLIFGAVLRAFLISVSMLLMLYAYTKGGTLAIVQTIHSMYILVPIILAVLLYNEHWNAQKVLAIIISVAALGLLG